MRTFILTSLIVLFGSASFADQCMLVPKNQARSAVDMMMKLGRLKNFCEPCGEINPTDLAGDTFEIKKSGYKNLYEVQVDGQTIDLAYTYADGLNLAKMVGCPAEGVSPVLPSDDK